MKVERIHEIERKLNEDEVFRAVGDYGMTALAMLVAATPGLGPAGVVLEKIKAKFTQPDTAGALTSLLRELESLPSELNSIDDRINAIESQIANGQLIAPLRAAFETVIADAMDPLDIENLGGRTNLTDVVVDDMRVTSIARHGGVTNVTGSSFTGSAKFQTDQGSEQNIIGTRFSSQRSGISTQAAFNKTSIQGNTTVEVAPPDASIGVRVTHTVGPGDPSSAALSITPDGVVFGGAVPRRR